MGLNQAPLGRDVTKSEKLHTSTGRCKPPPALLGTASSVEHGPLLETSKMVYISVTGREKLNVEMQNF